jgi:hypothetical protein
MSDEDDQLEIELTRLRRPLEIMARAFKGVKG